MPNKPIKCGTAKAWLSFATLHSLAKHLSAPYWGVRYTWMSEEEVKLYNSFRALFPRLVNKLNALEKEAVEIFNETFEPEIYEIGQIFAECVVEAYLEKDFEFVKAALWEVELIAKNGSEHISEFALVGIIESVLLQRSHKQIPLGSFDPWLGHLSKKFWYDMNDFFTGKAHS